MITRRVALEGAGLFLAQALVSKAQSTGRRTVFEHDAPDLTMKNWQVSAIEITYGPGESTAAHRHPGITIAYVLEGEVRSKVGDDPERTLKAGEMFLETPNQLHAVSGNASKSKPAKILAIMLAEKGKPLTTFA